MQVLLDFDIDYKLSSELLKKYFAKKCTSICKISVVICYNLHQSSTRRWNIRAFCFCFLFLKREVLE